ncbi:hypothetical protein Glove_117g480 [Diversispora epigaea]|uniref:Uncharacterized protein n=1 Tax=Diversispora epigaea TaxID=1348612 RepID=A0A397J906_9GLOM|nr:hypothetical protein Glove_117g480 [Diversispora epigaea]
MDLLDGMDVDQNLQQQQDLTQSQEITKIFLQDQMQKLKEDLKKEIQQLKQTFEENANHQLKLQELGHKNEELKNENAEHQSELQESERQNVEEQKSEQQNVKLQKSKRNSGLQELEELRKENAKYQADLGIKTNVQRDDSAQLKQDIEQLQKTLDKYVTTLKSNEVDIDYEKVNTLLQKYESPTVINPSKANRILVKATLQRYVLEEILRYSNEYFKDLNQEMDYSYLLANIAIKTRELSDLMITFSEEHKGDDKVTLASPIKLRQLIFDALGRRGFNNNHLFILDAKRKLNKSMNEYRSIKDETKKQNIEDMGSDLICDVSRIFFLRFYVQEPIPTYYFYESGHEINEKLMNLVGTSEECDEEMVVDVCSFSIIGKDLNDPSKRRILTEAKIYPRSEKVVQ